MASGVDLHKLMPYLLAGGAGAAAGGIMSGGRKVRSGETRGQYLTRVLRNAAVTGALAGGGSYAAGEGFKKTLGSVDMENPMTGTPGDQGPLASGLRHALFSPLTAAATGIGALGLTMHGKTIGANPNAEVAGKSLLASLKDTHGGKMPEGISNIADIEARLTRSPQEMLSKLRGDAPVPDGAPISDAIGQPSIRLSSPELAAKMTNQAKAVGLNLHDPTAVTELPKFLQKILGRESVSGVGHTAAEMARIPSMLIGRTTGRRIGRGALGLGAALLPAIAGSIATNAPPEDA